MSEESTTILPADPKGNYLAHQDEIWQAIEKVLGDGWYILGEEVAAFEAEFASYVGVAHAIGVGSGTDALHLALRVLGVGPGDGVLTVSHTAVATIAAIELAGGVPILVDIDPVTFTIDVDALESCISQHQAKRPKVIIPVHLYGHPADMPRIMEVAAKHDLHVLEDCAQAHGAMIGSRKVGTWGHMAAFSFYPTKNLGALGDGGAVVCNNDALAAQARLLRQYGWRERYISEIPGLNTRLDTLQAGILRVKLRHLELENERRRRIAARYTETLEPTGLLCPQIEKGVTHAFHQYTILSDRRDELAAFLRGEQIHAAVLYPLPVHLQPAYAGRILQSSEGLPNSERICRELLCLPMHPQLTDAEVDRVAHETLTWCESKSGALLA